jgi:polyferredoxin
MTRRFEAGAGSAWACAGAFLLTATLLGAVQAVVERPLLLAERYWRSGGWLEILALSVWAAWLTEKLLDRASQPMWRRRLWGLFAVVFFAQLALGLAGVDRMLMTGELHLPVPAVVLAGPIYRGGGFFMVVLFSATLLVVGPAWCSHLCYFGALDSVAAGRRRRPGRLPGWAVAVRIALLVLVVVGALLLGLAGVQALVAAGVGLTFGVAGLFVIALLSRRLGTMVHCTVYCPLGLVADVAGKISPFRIAIGPGCTECGRCSAACRFDALRTSDIARRRPGATCSLCGDCVGACDSGQIGYRFVSLDPHRARHLFVTLVAALHAVFLGVARM